MRFSLPNSRVMLHQPSGGFQGQASDIQRHAEDIMKVKRRLNEIYVHHTGQSYETIERTLDRDHFMSAEEAKAFGIVDEVMSTTRPARPRSRKQPDFRSFVVATRLENVRRRGVAGVRPRGLISGRK